MTKHEDSETRRLQVADALMTTVARQGLESTTLRDVAETAGVSVGLVQRYFRTRTDLLRFGIDVVYERVEERIQEVTITPPVRTILTEIVTTLLPLDRVRDQEFRVALAFWQASLHDPEMAATHRRVTQRLIDGLAEALEGAKRAGELPEHIDAMLESRLLVAVVDGLALHATITADSFDAATVTTSLDTHLSRLFDDSGDKT